MPPGFSISSKRRGSSCYRVGVSIPVRPGARQCVTQGPVGFRVSDSADSRIGSDVSGTRSRPGLPGLGPHMCPTSHIYVVVVLHWGAGLGDTLESISVLCTSLGVWPSSVCPQGCVAGEGYPVLLGPGSNIGKWHSRNTVRFPFLPGVKGEVRISCSLAVHDPRLWWEWCKAMKLLSPGSGDWFLLWSKWRYHGSDSPSLPASARSLFFCSIVLEYVFLFPVGQARKWIWPLFASLRWCFSVSVLYQIFGSGETEP